MKDYEWGPGWGLELAESAEAEEFIDGKADAQRLLAFWVLPLA